MSDSLNDPYGGGHISVQRATPTDSVKPEQLRNSKPVVIEINSDGPPGNSYDCFPLCYIHIVYVVTEVVSFQGGWSFQTLRLPFPYEMLSPGLFWHSLKLCFLDM